MVGIDMKAIPLFTPQNMSRVSEVTQFWEGGGVKGSCLES